VHLVAGLGVDDEGRRAGGDAEEFVEAAVERLVAQTGWVT